MRLFSRRFHTRVLLVGMNVAVQVMPPGSVFWEGVRKRHQDSYRASSDTEAAKACHRAASDRPGPARAAVVGRDGGKELAAEPAADHAKGTALPPPKSRHRAAGRCSPPAESRGKTVQQPRPTHRPCFRLFIVVAPANALPPAWPGGDFPGDELILQVALDAELAFAGVRTNLKMAFAQMAPPAATVAPTSTLPQATGPANRDSRLRVSALSQLRAGCDASVGNGFQIRLPMKPPSAPKAICRIGTPYSVTGVSRAAV